MQWKITMIASAMYTSSEIHAQAARNTGGNQRHDEGHDSEARNHQPVEYADQRTNYNRYQHHQQILTKAMYQRAVCGHFRHHNGGNRGGQIHVGAGRNIDATVHHHERHADNADHIGRALLQQQHDI